MENSIAKITTPGGGIGTCYFLAKNIVATCYHVIEKVVLTEDVEGANKWNACEIKFTETSYDNQGNPVLTSLERKIESLLNYDKDNDIAILELTKEIAKAKPVILSQHNTLPADTAWKLRGFPAIVSNGAPLNGKIQSLAALDINSQQRIELKADQIEENNIGGFSGSPVFVGEKVIGHLTSNAEKIENDKRKNIFGLLYAISGAHIRKVAENHVPGLSNDFGMVVFKDGEIYIKRGIEGVISDNLLKGGVCLSGYLKSGKTSTIHYFKEFEKDGIFLDVPPQKITSALVDLNDIGNKIDIFTLESLLNFFCKTIVREISSTEESFDPPDWDDDRCTTLNIASDWFKKEIFSRFKRKERCLFIYIDNGERIFEKFDPKICEDFFSMLRAWTTEAENSGVFGILMSFTDAFFLKDLVRPAMFNAITSPELRDFDQDEINTFAIRYCKEYKLCEEVLTEDQVDEIIKWTGGNPCLVRLLFEGIQQKKGTKNYNFEKVFKDIINKPGFYRNYLDILENALRTYQLHDELKLHKIDFNKAPEKSDDDNRRKLVKSGILVEKLETDGDKQYKLRCGLFSFQ